MLQSVSHIYRTDNSRQPLPLREVELAIDLNQDRGGGFPFDLSISVYLNGRIHMMPTGDNKGEPDNESEG